MAAVVVLAVAVTALVTRATRQRSAAQRLTALGARLGLDPPRSDASLETAVSYLETVTGSAAQAVTEASADAIRLRRALDTMPQGVVICDDAGGVVYRNGPAQSLVTSRHGDAVAAQAVTELLETGWREGAAERSLELYGPPRRTLSIRTRQIDDGRRPLGVIAVIEDVSERRRLDEIRRDFVANVSHELKTPMGALGLLAETLVAEPDTEVARRLAERIHTEAFRVSRIIDDLLDLSRIESEETPPRDPVLVNLVMAQALEQVRAAAEQRSIDIVMEEPSPPVAVLGDRRQLVSAMHALLENAVNYSYDGATVLLTARVGEEGDDHEEAPAASAAARAGRHAALGGEDPLRPAAEADATPGWGSLTESRGPVKVVYLSVVDHGIGIPARDLERIFERFYRVDHGRSRGTGGTGLGLSIVRHVAGNHHGRVDVESREGEGSTFTLVLPLHAEVAP